MTTTDRPKGGRRPEEFPEARARDRAVLSWLGNGPLHGHPGHTRNSLAAALATDRKLITYSLARLRRRGLVEHVARGCEGHGYWVLTLRGFLVKNERSEP
jgi:hypothetical protein